MHPDISTGLEQYLLRQDIVAQLQQLVQEILTASPQDFNWLMIPSPPEWGEPDYTVAAMSSHSRYKFTYTVILCLQWRCEGSEWSTEEVRTV